MDDSNELSDRRPINPSGESLSFCSINIYIRVKIYDERGAEQVKQFSCETPRSTTLKGLTARVIQADGSVTVLDNADLITSDNFRDGDELRTRYRFPIPDLRPGVIVDIKWKETFKGLADDHLFSLGDELPIRTSLLKFKHREKYICYFNTHNVPDGMKEGNYGVWSAVAQNVPIVPDEPYLPPSFGIQPWVCVFYASNTNYIQRDEFWKYFSKALDELLRFEGKSGNSAVSAKTAELTRGITDPKEKLRVLYEFCMREIANLDYSNSGYSEADIKEIDDDMEWGDVQDSAETLKSGRGHKWEISILFAAMAQSAGFETQIALCNDRSYLEWDINTLTGRMVPSMIVAVKNGDKWEYYQPGAHYMPFGMLRGGNEGTIAVLSNPDKAEFVLTPTAPSTDSVLSRTGTFTIDADGTLQGNAVFHYSGHKATSAKNAYAGMTLEARTDQFEDEVRASVPGAEISELQFDNIDDPCKDLEIRFKMTVPGFAEVTGERLLFQPSVFEKASKPVFTTETRSFDIRFP
ncbi:MAG TPA: DUF3857 domain-containing protein, partial [Opitutales bacterium]|nr:DUF3857 domain-containing protein [Opitutales bacterium]